MSAPFRTPPIETPVEIDDQLLAALIDSWTKRRIIDAYSRGDCSEELAIKLIRDGLVHA